MSTTVTSATLTKAEIMEILAGGRTTTYKPTIISFVKSGELFLDVMQQSPFNAKKIDSVFNSFNNNLKLLKAENPEWPTIEVRKEGAMCLLINVTALSGDVTDDTDTDTEEPDPDSEPGDDENE